MAPLLWRSEADSLQDTKPILVRGVPQYAKLMRYLWDNYIELSECENVVLVGHGTGCQAILDLINARGELESL